MNQIKSRKSFFLVAKIVIFVCISTLLNAQNLEGLKGKKPVKMNGTVGFGAMLTAQQGGAARRVPMTWYVQGSPTLSIYDVRLPFSFVYSERERNFTQPFNKYGVSPRYKWVTLHAGWRNVYYSDFTMSGATFFGGGIALNPGKFRFGAVYGKFRDKLVPDVDTLSRYSYVVPSYERWGYAAKIGFGKGGNFTDLIFFNAKDKVEKDVEILADSAFIKPLENVAIGLKSNYTFLKFIDLNIDMAVSAVTLDSRMSDSLIEIPKQLGFVNNLLKVNAATIPYLAGTSSLSFSFKKFKIKAKYKRVDPGYQTLGTYYMANDIEEYTVSPSMYLFKNKVILNGSYGYRRNNLLEDQLATTVTQIGSAFISVSPNPKLALSGNYSNYGTDLNSGKKQLNDSILFSIVNQAYGANARYSFIKAAITHSFILNGQFQNLNDNNIITRNFTESTTQSYTASYNLGNGKKKYSMGLNASFIDVQNYNTNFQLIGPSANYKKTFKKIKTSLGTRLSYQQKINNGESEGSITNIGFNARFNPTAKHTFGLNGNFLLNNTKTKSIYTFNEQRLSFRYNFQF